MSWLNPHFWASFIPSGLGQVKPHHFLDILKTGWQNKSELPFALRILRHGVCDGCALGTSGMKDWTMDGVHLCMVRLNLLQLNTMPALETGRLADVSALKTENNRELRAMGRLPFPMRRRRGERGFERISWDAALELVASRVRRAGPRRIAFYLTSRGITNEVYYVAQKVMRFLGSPHIDNSPHCTILRPWRARSARSRLAARTTSRARASLLSIAIDACLSFGRLAKSIAFWE